MYTYLYVCVHTCTLGIELFTCCTPAKICWFLFRRLNTRFASYMDSVVGFTQLASSLILISLRYWENYIDRDICSFQIQTIKNNLRIGRCKTYIFASLWKIGLTLAFAYILIPDMTPLAHLFRHVGNESAFDNSSLDYTRYETVQQDYFYPNPNYTNLGTNEMDYIPGLNILFLKNQNRSST